MPPLPPTFWSALESVPGASALHTIWKRHLGPDLETFTTLFLKQRPGDPAEFVPCPWTGPCGCSHKVLLRDNGTLAGICQCSPANCGEYTVLPEERITWDLDWPKFGRSLCRAFGLDFKIAQLGLFNTLQIGAWSKDAVPAILAIQASEREFLHCVTMLVARLGRPFILFAPTDKNLGLASKELLANLGSVFLPLSDHLTLSPNLNRNPNRDLNPGSAARAGQAGRAPTAKRPPRQAGEVAVDHPLPDGQSGSDGEGRGEEGPATQRAKPLPLHKGEGRGEGELPFQFSLLAPHTSTLFSGLIPQLPEPPDQDLASRVCLVLDELDTGSRRKNPSLTTVFRLYYVQQLPIAQVAKKCRCSVGTIMNRLKLLQTKTGATPTQLRRIGPHFSQFHDDLMGAKSDYHRQRRHNI